MTKKRKILAVLGLCFAGMALVGGGRVYTLLREYQAGKDVYSELSTHVEIPATPRPSASESPAVEPSDEPMFIDVDWPEVDFEALREINPDVVGWIQIEGTVINYPIVQGEDNTYYLKHLFNGETNSTGCIFLDCYTAADFSDRNNVVYGHHLNSGAMFTELMRYKEPGFYDAHPTALLMTPEGNYVVRFFSGFVSEVTGGAWTREFQSDEEFERWLEEMVAASAFASSVTPTAEDRVVTLSTCTYEFKNARFVLLGVMVPGR